jgi:hypothetical protein
MVYSLPCLASWARPHGQGISRRGIVSPMPIQQWSARRIGLALLAVLGLVVVLPAVVSWGAIRPGQRLPVLSAVACGTR